VKSRVTRSFRSCFSQLPRHVQEQARRAYALWRKDPHHRGLQFKRVSTRQPIHAVRIGRGWRALGLLEDDTLYWFWIGSHAEYDSLLKRT